MKKKVLLTSIATIALCLCLIAGSTFALFTSQSDVNISVTAGNVKMDASAVITVVESVMPDSNGTIEDEYGGKYSYLYSDTVAPYRFVNGGTADLTDDGAVLILNDITPGDKITLSISGTNTSDVAILCRYRVDYYIDQETVDAAGLTAADFDEELMKALSFSIDGGNALTNMQSYVSAWTTLGVGENMDDVTLTIELPVDTGNLLQNKSSMIRVLVEAVQGNADIGENRVAITYYQTTGNQ